MKDSRAALIKVFIEQLYNIYLDESGFMLLNGEVVTDRIAWLQGVIIGVGTDGIVVLDDGTGVVKCTTKSGNLSVTQPNYIRHSLKVGDYCLVKGQIGLLPYDIGDPNSVEIFDCGVALLKDPNLETLWNLENC